MARKPRPVRTLFIDCDVLPPHGNGHVALEGHPIEMRHPFRMTYKQAKRLHRWLGEALEYLEKKYEEPVNDAAREVEGG